MRYLLRSSLSVLLAFCMVFSNSYYAIASTTTEQSYDIMPFSTPRANDIVMSSVYTSNGQSLNYFTPVTLVDGSTNRMDSHANITGNTSDLEIGTSFKFLHTDSSGYSSYTDSVKIDMGYFAIGIGDESYSYTLRPTAVPSQAYVKFTGTYDFQLYDGSLSGYGAKRWNYDNSFNIIKPVSVSVSQFGQELNSEKALTGHDLSFSFEFVNVDDLLNDYNYRNNIYDYYEFVRNEELDNDTANIEDFVTDVIKIYSTNIEVIILYELCDDNFIEYWGNDYKLPTSFNANYWHCYLNPSPYHANTTFVNYSTLENAYMSDDLGLFTSLRNGFYDLSRSLSGSMSNIVTNATDNANRIIQNTTQKVDEVKQGVVDVKNSVVETKNSILDLPNKLKEMLTGFFVPDEDTINSKFAEFETLLSDRFGLIYQSAQIIHDFADSFQTQAVMLADTGGIIQLPSVTVNLAGTDFSFGGYDIDIIPDGFEFLQSAVRLATSMICTVVFINMCKNKLEAILR